MVKKPYYNRTTGKPVIAYPGQRQYAHTFKLRNKRIMNRPKCIVICTSTEHVLFAVQMAKNSGLKICVISTGHCYEGLSAEDDSLVVDVSQMNDIKMNSKETASLGAGIQLSKVLYELGKSDRIIPMGNCGSVGIAGLALGGGYGYLSRMMGLTCDYIKSLSLVSGNCEVIDASQDQELLKACKGGGNGNFGIVTEFEFQTVERPSTVRVAQNNIELSDSVDFEKVLSAWCSCNELLGDGCHSEMIIKDECMQITFMSFLNTQHTECVKLSHRIRYEFGGQSSEYETTCGLLFEKLLKFNQVEFFKNISGGFYDDSKHMINALVDLFRKAIPIEFELTFLGGKIQNEKFSSLSCFPHREAIYLCQIQTYWQGTEITSKRMAIMSDVQKSLHDKGVINHYRNYPDLNLKNWANAYYGELGLRSIRDMKSRHDPNNIFSTAQSVTVEPLPD